MGENVALQAMNVSQNDWTTGGQALRCMEYTIPYYTKS